MYSAACLVVRNSGAGIIDTLASVISPHISYKIVDFNRLRVKRVRSHCPRARWTSLGLVTNKGELS